jgi:hypothetical protein
MHFHGNKSMFMITTIIRTVLFLCFGIYTTHAQTTENPAYKALQTEREIGIDVTDECFLLLDSIFAKAEKITVPEHPDTTSVITICQEFSRLLETSFGFSYKPVQTLSIALKKKVLDCNYYSLLFYSFFSKIKNQALFPVIVPGHMFVRWYINDSLYVNYETTAMDARSDEEYMQTFKITEQTKKNCLYLCPMTDEQLTAVHWAEVAYDVSDTNLNLAVELNKQALLLDTNSLWIYSNLSADYYHMGMLDSSAFFFAKALHLDSMNYTLYLERGKMYLTDELYPDALFWLSKSIQINPDDPMGFMYRCYCYIKQKNAEKAMDDFDRANRRVEKKTLLSFLVNYPLLAYLDLELIKLIGDY